MVVLVAGLAPGCGLLADDSAKPVRQSHGPNRFGPTRASLLRRDVVVKDLELTDDQAAAIKRIAVETSKQLADLHYSPNEVPTEEKMRSLTALATEAEGKIDAVLSDKQITRLDEIMVQANGVPCIQNRTIADALNINLEQMSKVLKLHLDQLSAKRAAIKDAGGDRKAAHGKIVQIEKDSNEKMLAVLTPEQRTKFEQMQGKKIDLGDPAPVGGDSRRSAAPDSKPEATPSSR
jgi:Spy/CpxP family protein refolding chaperone